MVIFIGWSRSGKICAGALKKFLLACFPMYVNVSISEDIPKGQDWRSALIDQLSGTDYGILCLTRDSDSAWMCFEAGALACQKVPAAPLLFHDMSSDQIFSPLTSRQAVKCTVEDMRRLTDELYQLSGLQDWKSYEDAFQKAWGTFETEIQNYAHSYTYHMADFKADLKDLGKGVGDFDEWMMKRGGEVAAYLGHSAVPLLDKAAKVQAFMEDLERYTYSNGQYAVLRRKLENLVL